MATEIERKFLVDREAWTAASANLEGMRYRQGYVADVDGKTVRVRITPKGAVLTIKGPSAGIRRLEFEYSIPLEDAEAMLDQLCGSSIDKTRYKVEHGGLVWEVDDFAGADQGLLLAEVELESEEQSYEPPPWLGIEVSDDERYFNAYLAKNPYTTW